MNKLLSKTLKIAGRVYESLIPDEETARHLSEKYARIYHVEDFMKR